MKSELDYVKSNIGPKLDEIKDTYVVTIIRKKNITRFEALKDALEIHLNDTKKQLRRVEA